MGNHFKMIQAIYYDACKGIFSDICDCKYAIIKGAPLSCYAYNEAGKRRSSDIDVLISRSNICNIEDALKNNGFSSTHYSRNDRIFMLSSSHQIVPWFKELPFMGYVNVDINFDIFWGEYTGKRISVDEFLSDVREMNVYGCKIKTLSPLKMMIQLILHHYKEMNSIYHLASHDSINYSMFKDVYYLWYNNQNEIGLDKLYELSCEYEIIPYVYYILYFTNQIYNCKDLRKYVELFENDEGLAILNCYGLNVSERREWKVDFKTRLESKNLYELIKKDLTENDVAKLIHNQSLFGGANETSSYWNKSSES